ncbi:MAG: ABC transporter ATP-binding protein [Chloroflexi bacterium]|nr:ABC transporter ATP-binding protein [Chloroflexota bacterium]
MLSIDDLSSYYGQIQALKGISLAVEQGEIVALVGANGAGKTTLLNSISGLMQPREGCITFDGHDITHKSPVDVVKLGISHVPEHRQLFGTMTVQDNLLLGAYHRRRQASRKQLEDDIAAICAIFPILAERKNQLAGTLSGGEQQMLAIGRGMMAKPRLMLLDEPSLGLAPLIVKSLFEVIATLREDGTTIVLVEQNARAALRLADRAYVLETGKVVLEGAADDLLQDERVQATYLGGH